MTSWLLILIYLAFIGLGLPDSLLGSAWPSMHTEMQVSVSLAGGISLIISLGTVISSLCSNRLIHKYKTGLVVFVSTGLTALALFGFSISHSYWQLCLWAVPYGLGAGSIDAALNNYVAIHYASRHMSWLHCMWGLGAASGPYVMAYALGQLHSWHWGYRIIALVQIGLTTLLFLGLPLWKKETMTECNEEGSVLSLRQVLKLKGVKAATISFCFYSAIEQTAMLWTSTYLNEFIGLSENQSAALAFLFFAGITIGRVVSGFLTLKWNDKQMIYLGFSVLLIACLMLIFHSYLIVIYIGLFMVGLGCAPIYPSMIHSIPQRFGKEYSQSIVGIFMAFAYIGTCTFPPLFGLLANRFGTSLFPFYLALFLVLMSILFQISCRQQGKHEEGK